MPAARKPRAARKAAPTAAGVPRTGRPDRLAPLRKAFERHFERTLQVHGTPPGAIGRAIRYSALGPGKRLRPLLALTSCEAVGGRWRDALPAAAALECVHAFSLVHDDLPAMDDDDYRRGRLTTHRRFGEALGVLAGDALLAFAFEELTRLPAARRRPAVALEAVRLLAEAAGAHQLILGQALDIEAEGRRATSARVGAIHLRKTGALIAASMALGALAGGGAPRAVAGLHRAGLDLGLAFQIHDDLLNAGSSLAKLGKRAGTDESRGKATWPRAVGFERAREDERQLTARAEGLIRRTARRPEKLLALVAGLAGRER